MRIQLSKLRENFLKLSNKSKKQDWNNGRKNKIHLPKFLNENFG